MVVSYILKYNLPVSNRLLFLLSKYQKFVVCLLNSYVIHTGLHFFFEFSKLEKLLHNFKGSLAILNPEIQQQFSFPCTSELYTLILRDTTQI